GKGSFPFLAPSSPNRYQPKYQIRSTPLMSDPAPPSVPRSAGRALGQGGRDGGFAPATDDAERDLVAGLVGPDGGDHLAVVLDRLAVDGDHQVAGLDAGLGRRAVRGDLLDEGAVAATGGGERRGHAEVADLDLPPLADGRGRLGGDVDGDGEADADVAVGVVAGADGVVDADDAAMAGGEHAAGVARVDGGVGLDDLAALEEPVGGADDPGGHGLVEAERAADGDRELADLEVLADAERRRLEAGAVDLDHGHVVDLVGADPLALQLGAVGEPDVDLVDTLDDVGRGHDVAVGVVDEAGAQAVVVADLDHGRQEGPGHGGGRLLARLDGRGDRGGVRDAGAGRGGVVVEDLADAVAAGQQDDPGHDGGHPGGGGAVGGAGGGGAGVGGGARAGAGAGGQEGHAGGDGGEPAGGPAAARRA